MILIVCVVWLRWLQAWVVKIIRKVAVEFSREVEIIGGGGKLFLGGGLNILGSK